MLLPAGLSAATLHTSGDILFSNEHAAPLCSLFSGRHISLAFDPCTLQPAFWSLLSHQFMLRHAGFTQSAVGHSGSHVAALKSQAGEQQLHWKPTRLVQPPDTSDSPRHSLQHASRLPFTDTPLCCPACCAPVTPWCSMHHCAIPQPA